MLLLATPIFFLRANMKRPDNLSGLDRAVLRVSAPLEVAASSLAQGLSDLWGGYVYLVGVKEENERLSYDNARLRQQVHRLEHFEAENRQLQRLLQLRESVAATTLSARVIGKDFSEFFRVTRVVLDRDSRDVRPHMPVISPDGVVGSVLRVTSHSLDVQLAVDAAFGVDVVDDRTQARGFVRGTGDSSKYTCKVEHVDSRDDVEIGDLLVTSGKGKWFPKGLPVARVTRVTRREPGRDQEIEATPTVDFSRLESVLILVGPPSDDTQATDKAGVPSKTGASK